MTLSDMNKIPSKLLKKDEITLYKAFFLEDGERMDINKNFTIVSLTPEDAIEYFLNSMGMETFLMDYYLKTVKDISKKNDLMEKVLTVGDFVDILLNTANDVKFNLCELTFDTKELTEKELIDDTALADFNMPDTAFPITLKDKLYTINVADYVLNSVSFEVKNGKILVMNGTLEAKRL